MPHRSFQAALKLHRMKHLVEAQRRPKSLDALRGFIVDLSDSLLLVHRLHEDSFRLNGYAAIRLKDVARVRFFDSPSEWQCRAVEHFSLRAKKPARIGVASLGDLLASVGRAYPLVAVYTEKKQPDVCFIGEVAQVTATTLTLEELDCNGAWCRPRRISLADITRVDFAGGYEQALAATAPRRRKARNES
jgi:hypothetical protein